MIIKISEMSPLKQIMVSYLQKIIKRVLVTVFLSFYHVFLLRSLLFYFDAYERFIPDTFEYRAGL